MSDRPHTTLILAMTADGKIADKTRRAARFGSSKDKIHLEKQISLVDGVLFGAGTLRAYGTTLPITNPQLLRARKERSQPPQPPHIVCSASGEINPELRFFSQPVPRWLLTTNAGGKKWEAKQKFERILLGDPPPNPPLMKGGLEKAGNSPLIKGGARGGSNIFNPKSKIN